MGLKDVVRQAHGQVGTAHLADDHDDKVHPDYVLPRHREWMERPESERVWTEEALQFADDVMRGRYKHPRPGRISPSSMGTTCERELLFSYGGWQQEPFPIPNAEKMAAGEFHHLRWQMEGLSAGYLVAGEGWLHSESLRCGGSMDGVLDDGSIFELKSTASHLFKAIKDKKGTAVAYGAGMHRKHKLQTAAYVLVDKVGAAERGEEPRLNGWASIVYQDAGNPGDLYEVRLAPSESREAEVNAILEGLHDWIDLNELPDMLEACWKVSGLSVAETGLYPVVSQQEQDIFHRCPYRVVCPSASTVIPEN